MRKARVVRLDPAGFGFIEATHAAPFTFTFDQIEGYRGQKPSEIGLKEGVIVQFSVFGNGMVKKIVITSEPQPVAQ